MGLFDDIVIDRNAQCPYCKSYDIEKRAIVGQLDGTYKQSIRCNDCKKEWKILYNKDRSKVIDIEGL